MNESHKNRTPDAVADAVTDAASEAKKSAPGSFGRFADKYRARWAENHPQLGSPAVKHTASVPTPVVDKPNGTQENGDDEFARPRMGIVK